MQIPQRSSAVSDGLMRLGNFLKICGVTRSEPLPVNVPKASKRRPSPRLRSYVGVGLQGAGAPRLCGPCSGGTCQSQVHALAAQDATRRGTQGELEHSSYVRSAWK